MDVKTWGPLIGAVIGATAALGGALINQLFTRSSQRRHWVNDKKMEEYKELLSTLARTERLIAQSRAPMVMIGPEEQKGAWEAENEFWRVCKDRIFIADVMVEKMVLNRWAKIMRHLNTNGTLMDFVNEVRELRNSIMESAYKDLGIKGSAVTEDEERGQWPQAVDSTKQSRA